MKAVFLFTFLFAASALHAQEARNLLRAASRSRYIIPIRDSTGIYVGDDDSDTLFYDAVAPRGTTKGMLVLFPPTGQTVDEVSRINSDLAAMARDSGLLTIYPSVNHNLCLDKITLTFINAVLRHALMKYHPPRNKVVFGGFSLGGMNAIRYAELAYEDSNATAVKPAAVYGIDPPLDWARMYHSFSRAVQKNFSEVAVNEARYYLQRLDSEFGGNPEDHPASYLRYSMYSRTAGGGNAAYLKNIPVRIYSDPDIEWQLKNREVDYYDMNALDGAAMINQLHFDGNERAEFVNALGKGYRPDGARHPHSWSLAAPEDCISWIMACLR